MLWEHSVPVMLTERLSIPQITFSAPRNRASKVERATNAGNATH